MNRADEVFASGRVHAGFAADRTVDHREQRRRNLHVRNSALENGGYEP